MSAVVPTPAPAAAALAAPTAAPTPAIGPESRLTRATGVCVKIFYQTVLPPNRFQYLYRYANVTCPRPEPYHQAPRLISLVDGKELSLNRQNTAAFLPGDLAPLWRVGSPTPIMRPFA